MNVCESMARANREGCWTTLMSLRQWKSGSGLDDLRRMQEATLVDWLSMGSTSQIGAGWSYSVNRRDWIAD